MDMEEDRWPNNFLRKEIRGISNRNPTKCGKEFEMAMDEVGEGGIWETIKNGNKEELEEKIETGIRVKTDQEIQHDWDRIDKSKFCKKYKNRKDGIEIEKYWVHKEIRRN